MKTANIKNEKVNVHEKKKKELWPLPSRRNSLGDVFIRNFSQKIEHNSSSKVRYSVH